MTQHEGCVVLGHENKVFKLLKFILWIETNTKTML